MIHPRMATMLVGRPDRRDGRPGDAPRAPPAGGRADLGPAERRRRHEHERHGLPPRVGRGRRRAGPGRHRARRATLGRAIEAVARDLARQQAADGEGATTLDHVPGVRRDRRRRRAGRRPGRRLVILVKAAVHGRDPNWGRIAGAAGQRDARRRGRPRGGGPRAGRRRAARAGTPGDARSGPAPDRDRRPSRLRRAGTAARSRSTAPRPGRRWTRRSS